MNYIKEILELLLFIFKERIALLKIKNSMMGIKNEKQLSRFIEGLDGYIKECYHIKK